MKKIIMFALGIGLVFCIIYAALMFSFFNLLSQI